MQQGLAYNVFAGQPVIKLAAVGNIKEIKNYEYLLDAFANIERGKVILDIYGKADTQYLSQLQSFINKHNLSVNLKGPASSIHTILSNYHFFVMSSKNEGFGIAAIEAMAIGLPLILSNIEVFRNITYGNALFFNLSDINSFVNIIKAIQNNAYNLADLSANGKNIVQQHYTKSMYIDKMLAVYKSIRT